MRKMIKSIWLGKNKLYWLLLPFSLIYGVVVFLRRWVYKIGILKIWRAPIPVVIVGNLTVGGNGKTPFVIWLVQQFTKRGYRIGVVSRGYGGKSDNYPCIVTDETKASEAGDEPVLIYQHTRVPVAVAPKRVQAAKALLAKYSLDLIISDDGLQHYALGRDSEIVVIDGQFGFGNTFLLPAGPMREIRSRLKSVELIVINGDKEKVSLPANIVKAIMTIKLGNAINLSTGEACAVTRLKSVHAMAGIGHPDKFFTMLKKMGVVLEKCYPFADHHVYSVNELIPLAGSNEVLLMTEKDAVKCQNFAKSNWWYLPIRAELDMPIIDILLKSIHRMKKESHNG